MDLRSKYFLKKEDVLKCLNGDTYHIMGNPIGVGGGSVLYPAERNGTRVHFAIKECFPNSDSQELIFIRKNGVVQPKNPEDKEAQLYLENMRKQFCQEGYSSQEISNTNGRAVGVWQNLLVDRIIVDGEEYSARDGIFMTLERLNEKGCFLSEILEECSLPKEYGHPLRTGGIPHVYTTARIMEQLLKALDKVHQSGYLHGDVQDGNLFFNDARLDEGDIGFGCLIDFGCARKLNKDGKTEEISDRIIYSTLGFIAPEVVKKNDGHLRLTPAADIYSAGRLMLYLLKGKKFIRNGRDRAYTDDTLIEMLGTDCEKIGCGETAQKLINSILRNSLQPKPDDRYQDAGEMLEDVQRLVEELRPSKNRLSLGLSTLSEGEFLGREEELEQLDMSLRQHRNPIVIWGFGGMGKTELAIEFGRKKMGTCQVYFVRFDTSFYKTIVGPIADAFSGYSRYDARGREKTEEQVYEEVMKLLGELSSDDILIIDNVDSETEEMSELLDDEYRALCRLSLHLIITSRTRCEGHGIEVGELKRKQLYELMERFIEINENEMDALIDTVEGHTLTVELMARTLKYSYPPISVEEMLTKLKEGDLDSDNFAKVSVRKDRDERKRKIEGHLQCLFRMSDLSEEEQRYLQKAFLIGSNGMDYNLYIEAQTKFDQNKMQHLFDRGWVFKSRRVERDRETISDKLMEWKEEYIHVHPLIVQVGIKKMQLSFIACKEFLEKLWEKVDIEAVEHAKSQQILSVYNRAEVYFFDEIPVYMQVRKEQFELADKYLKYLREHFDYFSMKEIDELYKKLNSYCDCQKYVLPCFQGVYRRIAVIYAQYLKEYEKAIEAMNRALNYSRKDKRTAMMYQLIGEWYAKLGKHEKALYFYWHAYGIYKVLRNKSHPDNSLFYVRMSESYRALNKLFEERVSLSMALKIFENAIKNEWPSTLADDRYLVAYYQRVSWLYHREGKENDAKISSQKAKIFEENPLLSHVYISEELGWGYCYNGDDVSKVWKHLLENCR